MMMTTTIVSPDDISKIGESRADLALCSTITQINWSEALPWTFDDVFEAAERVSDSFTTAERSALSMYLGDCGWYRMTLDMMRSRFGDRAHGRIAHLIVAMYWRVED